MRTIRIVLGAVLILAALSLFSFHYTKAEPTHAPEVIAPVEEQEPVEEPAKPETKPLPDKKSEVQLYAIVDVLGLRVRQEATTESDILEVMVSGDIVPILDEKDGWLEVQFGHVRGWVDGSYVNVVDHYVVTGNTAQVAETFVSVPWEVNCDDIDPYNGYYYRGDCMPGVVSLASRDFSYPKFSFGNVAYYSKGIMEHVIESKGYDMTGYNGGVALESCKEVGKSVNLWVGGQWDGPYLVVDCAARSGVFRNIVYQNLAVEVGWETYQKWVNEGIWQSSIGVCKGGGCSGAPVSLRQHWLSTLTLLTAP